MIAHVLATVRDLAQAARADESPDVRVAAIVALGKIGAVEPGAANSTVPALVDLLADAEDGVRTAAGESLAEVGAAQPAVVVPPLTRALASPSAGARREAAKVIGRIGGDA